MAVKRTVANNGAEKRESARSFYRDMLDMHVAMGQGARPVHPDDVRLRPV